MTVTWGNITVPDSAWNDIHAALAIHPNVPPALAIAVAYAENGSFDSALQSRVLDPTGPNGREDSWGYFQLYKGRLGGLGTGYTTEQLQDGRLNAEIAISEIARRISLTGLSKEAIQPWSTRDTAWQSFIDNPILVGTGVNQPPIGSTPPDARNTPPQGNQPVPRNGTTIAVQDTTHTINPYIIAGFLAIAVVAAMVVGEGQRQDGY